MHNNHRMSVFHLTPSQVQDTLNELPAHHTKEMIVSMVDALQADIKLDPPGQTFTQTVHKHANKHKELFFSYPMLFRTICKGTYRQTVLDVLLDAKQAIESGQKNKKEALEQVIRKSVEEVSAIRAKEKND